MLTIPTIVSLGRGRQASPYAPGIRSLIGRLPEGVELSIAATESALGTIRQWPEFAERAGGRTIPVDDAVDFSFWCQDEILAGEAGGRPVLLRSSKPKRAADAAVAEIVGAAMGIDVVRSDTTFEGGNVLVGDDFVLAGVDILSSTDEATAAALALDPRRRVYFVGTREPVPQRRIRLVEWRGKPLVEEVWSGTGRRQPIFHLDAFVSLAGRGRDGRFRILLGDPRLAYALTGDERVHPRDQAVCDAFDSVAGWFASQDEFEVIRNPLPVIYADSGGFFAWSQATIARQFAGVAGLDEVLAAMAAKGLAKAAVRRWYFATQNSAIALTNTDGRKTVLLPTFAHGDWRTLAPSERANADIWRALGYAVVELDDFHPFAQNHGSAHCVFKVLAAA